MDLSNDKIEVFKTLLKGISLKELNNRIKSFNERIDLRRINEEKLKQELNKILSSQFNNEPFSFFLKTDTVTNKHHQYYFKRIRKFTEKDFEGLSTGNFASLKNEQDVWAKPKNLVWEYGRLNKPNQSILYTASETLNAIYETRCLPDDFFFLLIYKNKKQLRTPQIHNIQYMDEFTEEENAKILLFNHFLLNQFTKQVLPGREYQYKSSVAIYESFFYDSNQDGFIYPSISSECKMGFNIAFNEKQAKENLDFLGLMICQLIGIGEDSEFELKHYFDGFLNDNGGFDIYTCKSEISKERFGLFDMIRQARL
jgi:hypothetical protein